MLGTIYVKKPCGVDVINDSIEAMVEKVPKNEWNSVKVDISMGKIVISFLESQKSDLEIRYFQMVTKYVMKKSSTFLFLA